jgi:hypothetical protein
VIAPLKRISVVIVVFGLSNEIESRKPLLNSRLLGKAITQI